jgi:3'(2'), 5'-bisphosphate nucleotidase
VSDLSADVELAADLASGAGRLLLELRAAALPQDELRKAGDHQSNDYLLARLAQERPDDAVLSEESADDPARLDAERVWIVDPLDGTREFGEPPRSDWAIHVALWAAGDLVAGAVAMPALDHVFVSAPPRPLPGPIDRTLRVVVSRSRPPAITDLVAARLGAEVVTMGSAGAKAMSVLLGDTDIYLHGGGQYEWDSAAPAVVCRAAGLHVSRTDGSPLVYNQADPWMPDLLVCRPELASATLAAIAAVGGVGD